MQLQKGQTAPDFNLPDANGEIVNLSNVLSERHVVLYFYPKDNTPGCTMEANAFRDSYTEFAAAGAQVIGVSADSGASHCSFREKHKLPFILLSDKDHEVSKAYGVNKSLGLLPGRETFVIGWGGIVLHRFRSQFNARKHVTEALRVLRENM